ncbi:MAG: alpha-galactosidase [Phycisphaerae bacterium]|nr:alpha-galactosidase [Phycisphaerae bacterium]
MPLKITWTSSGGFSLSADGETIARQAAPVLYWRPTGQADWRRSPAVVTAESASPDRIELSCTMDAVQMDLQAARVDERTWEFTGQFQNTSSEDIELARLHYAEGDLLREFDLLAPMEEQYQRFTPHSDVKSYVERYESLWSSMRVIWPRLKDPIHVEEHWAIGTEFAAWMEDWNRPALFCGFTGPGTAHGEIGMRTRSEARMFFGARLDNVLLKAGATRPVETCVLIWGDVQEAMRYWARRCVQDTAGRAILPPLTGWCSWYQYDSSITPEHVTRAANEFADWPIPPGGRTIQIDDGFQVMPGDWRPNDKFREGWSELPARIAETGSMPGLWLAPTTVFCQHPIVTEHPDWLQRMPDGTPAVSFSNWEWCAQPGGAEFPNEYTNLPTYFLDPDHPGAREFMYDIVRSAVAAGWKYLKLDFTYPLSTARKAHDPTKTQMESLCSLYQLFREAAGEDAIICSCAGMDRWALGYADTARLGADINGDWKAIRNNMPEFFPRLATNGVWWNGDPDVFFMRSEHSKLNLEESWFLTGTVGLIGGVFLTSDFASQWSDEAARRVQYFWNETGPIPPGLQRGVYESDGKHRALCVTRADGKGWRVGLYNWSDEAAAIRVSLEELQVSGSATLAGSFPETPPICLDGGELVCENQPPHSMRIAELSC